MKNPKIRVSGNHIGELSENIPSNIFALNELIKNSYDACASFCEVKIDSENNKIWVIDNGKGLNEANISELFHISKSSKRFGAVQTCGKVKRRVQGSKGLGFLAAFRFGHNVEWDTSNSGTRYVFGANKNILTSLDDIGSHTIEVETQSSTISGTTIKIDSDSSTIEQLTKYFSDDNNALKLVGAFTDESFEVILTLPKSNKKTNLIPELKNINGQDQLFYVVYDSNKELVEIYRSGYLEKSIPKKLGRDDYDVQLEIMIYSLESYGKRKICPYFYKPDGESITPLVFINDNLFNNYGVFDADIFRSRRSHSALPQMIGYVKVYSDSKDLEFNSDRTNFVENAVTDSLISDLRELNELIQSVGSELKSQTKLPGGRVATGPAFPKPGTSNPNEPLHKANITLRITEKTFYIPAKQIDLLDYVRSIKDSSGNDVPSSQLQITVDNESSSNVISSVTKPCRKIVNYKFNDPVTAAAVAKLTLNFEERKASVIGGSGSVQLFYIPNSKKDYSIKIRHVSHLMEQASEAERHAPKFSYLIACSLRTIFELSSQALKRNRGIIMTHEFRVKKERNASDAAVVQVIHFLNNNNSVTTRLAEILGVSYGNLKRALKLSEFKQAFQDANIGAHSGAQFLTSSAIRDIAKLAGYYAVFCDALIYEMEDQDFDGVNIVDI